MGAVNTTYTFATTDVITSTRMNNIIDQTTMTSDAILGTTLEVASGKLKIRSQGITSNEMASNSVTTSAIANGAVTQAKTSNCLVPTGAVMAFAMNVTPTGWMVCNGTLHSRTTYAALFEAIGTLYGAGDGSTTFALPDLRGYFVRGFGGASGDFGVQQDDAFENFTGTIQIDAFILPTGAFNTDSTTRGEFINTTGVPGPTGSAVKVELDPSTVARTSTETRPKNIPMRYCIKI